MPVEASAKVLLITEIISEEIFNAQIATMCFASWLSSLPRDQVRRGRPFSPKDGRIFFNRSGCGAMASSCRLPRSATATHGISRPLAPKKRIFALPFASLINAYLEEMLDGVEHDRGIE